MEKVIYSLLLILSISQYGMAQDAPIIRAGLLRGTATISPSYLFSEQESYFYLHGQLEGYVEDKVSISGEIFYSLGGTFTDAPKLNFNHNLFFGANYHFATKNHDLFIGLQPGVALSQYNADALPTSSTQAGINPVVSTVVGYNFYANKFLHFFVHNRLILGRHFYDQATSLTEYRFSAGLGFNINAVK